MSTEYKFLFNCHIPEELRKELLDNMPGNLIGSRDESYLLLSSEEDLSSLPESFALTFSSKNGVCLTIYTNVNFLKEVLVSRVVDVLKGTDIMFSVATP